MHSSISDESVRKIENSIDRVEKWVEDRNYQAYEPFDGLSSWARPFGFGTLLGDRLLMQLIRQSPINLRPLLGVSPKPSTKGQGYMAWGYLARFRTTGEDRYKQKAEKCLRWLDTQKAERYDNHSWANHFDFSSRTGKYTSKDPIIVWTALIGHAYIEAFEATQDEWFLKIADSVCKWILDVPREQTPTGTCLSYLADRQSSIHNANMLGGAILARTAKHNGKQEYFDVAKSAMEYSCVRQLDDGAWWYSESDHSHWIDNFHSGYNLDSLKYYIDYSGDETWHSNLLNGLQYLKENFFEDSGRPKYYHDRTYPVDSQCAAQAIDTLSTFSELDPDCLDLSIKVANWWIDNMQDKSGYFYYRQYPLNIKAKTPMLHWSQATIYKGLAKLLERIGKSEDK
jgi:hypothetical protein